MRASGSEHLHPFHKRSKNRQGTIWGQAVGQPSTCREWQPLSRHYTRQLTWWQAKPELPQEFPNNTTTKTVRPASTYISATTADFVQTQITTKGESSMLSMLPYGMKKGHAPPDVPDDARQVDRIPSDVRHLACVLS